jgi:hypothetical protein
LCFALSVFFTSASFAVSITDKGNQAIDGDAQNQGLLKIVTDNNDLGLTVDDGILFRVGKPYRGIGANYFNLLFDTSRHNNLRRLSEAGIPFVRFMCSGFWPADWQLYLHNKEAYFEMLDDVVKTAEKYRIGLIPSLFWNVSTVSDIVGEPVDQFGNQDSNTIAFVRKYTEDIVTRYKDSPAIWGWEFGNEYNLLVDLPNAAEHRPAVQPIRGTPPRRTERDELSSKQMLVVLGEFARTVRKHDKRRIIITGNSVPRASAYHNTLEKTWTEDTLEQFGKVLLRDNPDPFDTICVHIYPNESNKYPGRARNIGELVRILQRYSARAKKPLFIGEFGAPIQLGKEKEQTVFKELLAAIETNQVPLAAFWVFNLSSQNDTWNVTFDNNRSYMLDLVAQANMRIQQGEGKGGPLASQKQSSKYRIRRLNSKIIVQHGSKQKQKVNHRGSE